MTEHGAYMISNNGASWSHIDANFNSKINAFTYDSDVIICIFDPIKQTLTFKRNKNTFELKVKSNLI